MGAEQTAATIAVSSVLAWPAWQGVKALFWKAATRLWPDVEDTLDEDTEAWGPGSDEPIPCVVDDTMAVAANVVPMDPALVVDWHARGDALTDTSLEQTLTAWSTAAAVVPARPNTPEWYAEWDRLLDTSPLPVDPETYLDPDDCRLCGGDGVYEVRNWATGDGDLQAVTCPSCKGSGERGAR